MGQISQRKGAAGERELAAILQEHGYSYTRGGSLSFEETPDLTGLPGVYIEVKRVERLNVQETMEQSIRDAERMQDGIPALFHRRNRKTEYHSPHTFPYKKLCGRHAETFQKGTAVICFAPIMQSVTTRQAELALFVSAKWHNQSLLEVLWTRYNTHVKSRNLNLENLISFTRYITVQGAMRAARRDFPKRNSDSCQPQNVGLHPAQRRTCTGIMILP